ncbi:MAG: flagellar biosynthesis protein FlhF [Spirochaetota bacterium]|nr:flagellar biosynthesis protein FlhF [Spirochaetota bacterium]
MEYKKYRAKTFQEAKLKMLLDIGNHAYIISQKKVKEGGFLGLFGKPVIEITAGVMKPGLMAKKNTKEQIVENRMDPDLSVTYKKTAQNNTNQLNHAKDFIEEKKVDVNKNQDENLRGELSELKSLIAKILSDKDSNANKDVQKYIQPTVQYNDFNKVETNKAKELIRMFLKEEDFDDNFIDKLCSSTSLDNGIGGDVNLTKIKDYIRNRITEIIYTTNGIEIDDNTTNIIVITGPTGVGKTTTLAKLGAYFGVFQKKKVKFISIDTYRVGAIQQLKLYSDIMEIPFAKVNSIEDFKIEVNTDKYDLILVDTSGRSQKSLDEVRDIKKYIDVLHGKVHISLVISATTKYKDLVEILDKFDILNYTNIIVTKLDETNSLGQVISAISAKKRALSYVTFGQSVPEDIEEASKDKFFDMVLKK